MRMGENANALPLAGVTGVEFCPSVARPYAGSILGDLGAYGRTGPLKDRPGYDPLMQAHGGIMSVTGIDGGEPVRVGVSIVDQGAGMWAAMGILAALNRRHITGEGSHVSTSLYETAIGWMSPHIGGLFVTRAIGPSLCSGGGEYESKPSVILPASPMHVAGGHL